MSKRFIKPPCTQYREQPRSTRIVVAYNTEASTWVIGPLTCQGDSKLIKGIMFRRLVVQGPKRGDRPATSWGNCPEKNLRGDPAQKRRTEMGHRSCCQGWAGLDDCCEKRGHMAPRDRGASGSPLITPGEARTSANPTCSASARLVDLHSSYVCDFVWFAFLLLLLIVFSCNIGESGMGSSSCFVFIFCS